MFRACQSDLTCYRDLLNTNSCCYVQVTVVSNDSDCVWQTWRRWCPDLLVIRTMSGSACAGETAGHRRLFHLVLAFLLVLFLPARRVTGTADVNAGAEARAVVATFDSPIASGVFNHLAVNTETQTLYVGAVNHLYSLHPNLTLWQVINTGPELDNPDCPPPMPQLQDCTEEKKPTDSYNKALVVDYTNQRLIACSR